MEIKKGTTSRSTEIFLSDSAATDGSGKTGILYSGVTGYYIRPGDIGATAITMATATIGTYASGGFIEVDATNMPGIYEFGIPDACLATGAEECLIMLKGTGFADLPIRIELRDNTSKDVYDAIFTIGRSEPGLGAPPVSTNMATKSDYLYKFMRNRIISTTSQIKIFADDGTTVDHISSISDDGTAFIRGEFASG